MTVTKMTDLLLKQTKSNVKNNRSKGLRPILIMFLLGTLFLIGYFTLSQTEKLTGIKLYQSKMDEQYEITSRVFYQWQKGDIDGEDVQSMQQAVEAMGTLLDGFNADSSLVWKGLTKYQTAQQMLQLVLETIPAPLQSD